MDGWGRNNALIKAEALRGMVMMCPVLVHPGLPGALRITLTDSCSLHQSLSKDLLPVPPPLQSVVSKLRWGDVQGP